MEAPLANCWMPDSDEEHPTIQFTWDTPQTVGQIVFYDAPPEAGDIKKVRITDDTSYSVDYELPNGSGEPCRLYLEDAQPIQSLTIEILQSEGDVIGLSKIEILPGREQTTQWIHLLDTDGNFIYEYPCPAEVTFGLLLYGYPSAPAQATAYITKEGSDEVVAEIQNDGESFWVPPLTKGRYTIRVVGGGCSVEALLRVGDSLFMERVTWFIERQVNKILPD